MNAHSACLNLDISSLSNRCRRCIIAAGMMKESIRCKQLANLQTLWQILDSIQWHEETLLVSLINLICYRSCLGRTERSIFIDISICNIGVKM